MYTHTHTLTLTQQILKTSQFHSKAVFPSTKRSSMEITYYTTLYCIYHALKDSKYFTSSLASRFGNREEFVRLVHAFRLRELSCWHRMASVRCGLASVMPLQLIRLFTPLDLDLRVCGLPDINLEYLRVSISCLFVVVVVVVMAVFC